MPVASPPIPPKSPAPLQNEEQTFIKEVMEGFYGLDSIVRSYGSDPSRLDLHVETDALPDMRKYDCLGVLMTRIDRQISLEVTTRGTKAQGSAKIAYRRGIIL